MYFFFSGEGKTDAGTHADQPGPVAHVANQIIAEHHHYSFLESERVVFVHRAELERIKNSAEFKPQSKRTIRLRSPNVPPETRYYHDDARAFSRATKHVIESKDENDREFVAILFRDSDSPTEKEWNDKRNSMIWGFHVEKIGERGVAAVARPISEAWWLSAIYRKEDSAKDCRYLEETPHGGKADHALKVGLREKLGTESNRTILNAMVTNRDIDYKLIDSESFLAFRRDFETAVGLEHLYHTNSAT
jgi:hypothetical protein